MHPIYVNSASHCAVMYFSGSNWANALLGDGGSGITGGVSVLRANFWVFARRDDGNVIVFYYR